MLNTALRQAISDAVATGPMVLLQGESRCRRPADVVTSRTLSVHDKRAILAAWASDYYAVDSKPALRQIPGIPEPITIDELQEALRELDLRYGL